MRKNVVEQIEGAGGGGASVATTWEGILLKAEKIRPNPRRAVLKLTVNWRIYDEGDLVFEVKDELMYPLWPFSGVTRAQARQMLLNDGVGETPSLKARGALILQDWDDLAPILEINLPVTFGP